MRLVCSSKNIFGRLRPGAKMKDILNAGFDYGVYDLAEVCLPMEFANLKRKNYKREQDIYLTEEPERLTEVLYNEIFSFSEKTGLKLPIAIGPTVSFEVKKESVNNEIVKKLSEEMIKAAVKARCERVVIHPISIGVDVAEEWEINKHFYMGLSDIADDLNSDIRILLVNKGKDINGHIVRGICAEPQEMVKWVDELNGVVGKKRFACCFDVGTATLCGQNLFEAIVPLGDRLEAVIARDCDGINDVSMLPYTACEKGPQTNWRYLIRALRKVDFDGDLIMEFSSTYIWFSDLLRASVLKLAHEVGEFFIWQINIEKTVKKYDKRVLFGAGNMCRAYMKNYGEDYPPLFTCDNNSARWGEKFSGLIIENPEKLKDLSEDIAIFICNIYYNEIEEQLRTMGLKNPIERFNDEYLATDHMDRLKMAKDPNSGKGG